MRVPRRGCALARRWWWLIALVLAWIWCGVRWPTERRVRTAFPGATPHAVAHLLADWSTQPHAGRWAVDAERTNYTSWLYSVRYECGARCEGRAHVHAAEHADGHPTHGQRRAAAHRVQVQRYECSRLPLLPWPHFCDESEIVHVVEAQGAGAAVATVGVARCGPLQAAAGWCASRLQLAMQWHLRQVTDAVL